MSHGPFSLVVDVSVPRGFVRWRCDTCTRVVDFHDDPRAGSPSSGTDRPPADVDAYLDRCVVDDATKLLLTLEVGITKATDAQWKAEAQRIAESSEAFKRRAAAEASGLSAVAPAEVKS